MPEPTISLDARRKMHATMIYAVFNARGNFYKAYDRPSFAQAQATRIGGVVRPFRSVELLTYD